MVGSRARVTASNNVFSPLCVLAVRGRAEDAATSGDERGACHHPANPRARRYPTWGPRACLYTLRNQFRQYRLLRAGNGGGGGRTRMKRGSPSSRPRLCLSRPLSLRALNLSRSLHSTKGAVDGFLRSSDGATPKSPRPFVSASRSSFD